jgi:DNA-binding PadR family transcriptional regulator
MARARQTELAVLGVLSVQPMTGYAVREAIRDVLGHFWSESFGQIYPTLANLHREGILERSDGERSGSSIYALSATGQERLMTLLRQPDKPLPPRNGFMLRLFFGHTLGPDACRALIQQAKAEAQQQLHAYQGIRAELATEDQYAEHRPYWLLTVSAGEHNARATIAWADESLATLSDTLNPPDDLGSGLGTSAVVEGRSVDSPGAADSSQDIRCAKSGGHTEDLEDR